MTFNQWCRWVSSLPWSRRWFVCLIAMRPILDALYFLKDISLFFSPLYFVGIMTPIVVMAALAMGWLPRSRAVWQDYLFGLLMAIVLANCLFVMGIEVSVGTIEVVFKVTMPFVVYFFARKFIRTGDDLMGVVTTFVFSSIVPFSLLFYETVYDPFGVPDVTRGDLVRLEGLYADAVSYAVYSTQAFLCLLYMFLARTRYSGKNLLSASRDIVIGFCMCLLCLLAIKHAASWAVVAALLMLVVVSGGQKGGLALICGLGVLVTASYFVMGERIKDDTATLYKVDLAVMNGDMAVERGLHGRVSIWKRLTGYWVQFPLIAKIFGSPISMQRKSAYMLLGSAHNDYLRMTFLAGLFGLALYCGFFLMNLVSSVRAAKPERFLIRGMLLVYAMYSLTIMPSLYPPCIYLGMSIFAYSALVDEVSNSRRVAG